MIDQDDSKLVQRVLRGDRQAFECLIEKYQKPIYNVAFRMTRDRDEAADVSQSTFLKAYEKLQTFNPKYKFFSWLYRIAINESLNSINRMESATEQLNDNLPSQESSLEDSLHANNVSNEIQDALLELDLSCRAVIILRHFQDLSYEEIAEVLDIPAKTVKSRLFTARSILRSICSRRGIV